MDREAESRIASSKEKRRNEQDTNARGYERCGRVSKPLNSDHLLNSSLMVCTSALNANVNGKKKRNYLEKYLCHLPISSKGETENKRNTGLRFG